MFMTSEDGMYLFVKIIPKAHKSEIIGWENDRLKIRIAAIPENGLANAELIRFLSSMLGIAKSQVILVQGEKSRLKKMLIKGVKEVDYDKLKGK